MSAQGSLPNPSPPASRWRLWVDGCGGFLLLDGDRWTVGGFGDGDGADICARADWPRFAGTILREDSEYFWVARNSKAKRDADENKRPELITDGQSLPIPGTATMILSQPSPLCSSASLHLESPHRFTEHVDAVVMVNDTLLIGPDADCHIRAGGANDRVVLTRRDQRWLARVGLAGDFVELSPQTRLTLSSLTMTLEEA